MSRAFQVLDAMPMSNVATVLLSDAHVQAGKCDAHLAMLI